MNRLDEIADLALGRLTVGGALIASFLLVLSLAVPAVLA